MGRGLSELQGWILWRTLRNLEEIEQSGRPPHHACLIYAEIKSEFFRMPTSRNDLNGWRFRKNKLADYNKVSATISRAAHLLEGRELISVWRRGQPLPASVSEMMRKYRRMLREEDRRAAAEGRVAEALHDTLTDLSMQYTPTRAEIRLTEKGVAAALNYMDVEGPALARVTKLHARR
jgi:hypothetical protein